jgi:hypothetical protein
MRAPINLHFRVARGAASLALDADASIDFSVARTPWGRRGPVSREDCDGF